MSRYKINLKVKNSGELKDAIRSYAKKQNLTVTEGKIKDYYGNKVKCDIGLTGTGLQYGIGFTCDKDNNVNILGDTDMQGRFKSTGEEAKNYINAFRAARKAKQINPFASTSIKMKEKKAILEVQIP